MGTVDQAANFFLPYGYNTLFSFVFLVKSCVTPGLPVQSLTLTINFGPLNQCGNQLGLFLLHQNL